MRNAHAVPTSGRRNRHSWPGAARDADAAGGGRAGVGLAGLLPGSTGRARSCWPAAGTTAAMRCTRGPGWPAAVPRWWPSPRVPGCTPGAPPRCGPRAGFVTGPDGPDLPATMRAADLVLDGLLGIGGRGELREPRAALAALAEAARGGGATVVAVDLPSGVDADTGEVTGAAVSADVTVTFGTWKTGLLDRPRAPPEPAWPTWWTSAWQPHLPAPPPRPLFGAADVAALLPRPGRESDKYRRGVLGIVAGSDRFSGAAALLAVGGALRGGAGMVRLVTAEAAAAVVRQHWPEAVITVTGEDGGRGGPPWAGSRPGWPVPAWAPMSRRAAGSRRCSPPTCRCWWTPTGSRSSPSPRRWSPGAGQPRCSPRTRANWPGCCATDPAQVTARRAEHARAAARAYGCCVLLRNTLHHGDRGRRRPAARSTRRARAGWPPPTWATFSPGWRARCSPRGLGPQRRRRQRRTCTVFRPATQRAGQASAPAAKRRSGPVT